MRKKSVWLPEKGKAPTDFVKVLAASILATAVNAMLIQVFHDQNNVSGIYILAVLYIAINTKGYFWSLLTAVFGVIGTNFFFTYPYFALNFTLSGYPITFLIMLFVAVMVGTLAVNLTGQMELAKTRERQGKELNQISRRLMGTSGREEIVELLLGHIGEVIDRPIVFCPTTDWKAAAGKGEDPGAVFGNDGEKTAMMVAFSSGECTGSGEQKCPYCAMWYVPAMSGGHCFGVAGVRCREYPPLTAESRTFVRLMLSQFAMALERQKLNQQQQQILLETEREQVRSNLLRAISHDLRTPLTGILGASSAILENGERISEKERGKLIRDINEDADWLLRMVENILSLTRISPEGSTLKKMPEPAEEIAGQAVQICRKRFPKAQIQLDVPSELIMVPMDGLLIEQVLINLIENAVQHGGQETPIHVMLSAQPTQVVFTVRDYGPGIPPGVLDKLFCGFFAKGREGGDASRGLGIGLSICKTIVDAHGGVIRGENGDKGAVFTFSLPLEE